jgi:hypothetical protein
MIWYMDSGSAGRHIPFVHESWGKSEQSNPCTGLDRPLRLQEAQDPRISRQSAHEGCQPYAPAAFNPPGVSQVLISVRSWVDGMNRNRDLRASCVVTQPTPPPRTPSEWKKYKKYAVSWSHQLTLTVFWYRWKWLLYWNLWHLWLVVIMCNYRLLFATPSYLVFTTNVANVNNNWISRTRL